MKFTLNELGWSKFFQDEFDKIKNQNITVGRVANQQKNLYHVFGEFGELPATVSGKFRFNAVDKSDFPVVGDWVVLGILDNGGSAIIQRILPRRTKISRKVALKKDSAKNKLKILKIQSNIPQKAFRAQLKEEVKNLEKFVFNK